MLMLSKTRVKLEVTLQSMNMSLESSLHPAALQEENERLMAGLNSSGSFSKKIRKGENVRYCNNG